MSTRLHMLASIHEWDVFTFQRITTGRPVNDPLVTSARYVSHTGNGYLYPLVLLVILLAGLEAPLQFLKFTLAAFGIERLIYFFAKNKFRRRRPANILPDYRSVIIASDEFSFPSGHSSAAFLMVTLLVLFYGPLFAVLYLWSAAVAVSRVILGVHFPTDILVGSIMGATIALSASSFFL